MLLDWLKKTRGEAGLERVVWWCYLSAACGVLSIAFVVLGRRQSGSTFPGLLTLGIGTALAFAAGKGLENRQPWARILAYAVGVLYLLIFPVGTILGAIALVSLYRADQAGLFRAAEKTTTRS